MLPAPHRLRRSDQFGRTVRLGARAGRSTLVVHLASQEDAEPARVGFVVSKAVGNAVTRNLVKRRLRAVCAPLVADLPHGTNLVVRALPAAAKVSFAVLDADLRSAVVSASRRRTGMTGARSGR